MCLYAYVIQCNITIIAHRQYDYKIIILWYSTVLFTSVIILSWVLVDFTSTVWEVLGILEAVSFNFKMITWEWEHAKFVHCA